MVRTKTAYTDEAKGKTKVALMAQTSSTRTAFGKENTTKYFP